MRFRNLTITLTLTCLSIVAIVGLALLPITDGICGWEGDERSKTYYTNSYDNEGKGWHLYAYLSASYNGASASVNTSIYGEKAFGKEKIYSGTASVNARRGGAPAPTIGYCPPEMSGCHWRDANGNCGGHLIRSLIKADQEQNTDKGEEQTIVTKVTGIEYWIANGKATTEKDGTTTTVDGNVEIKVKDWLNLDIGASHTWIGEDSLTYTGEIKAKITRYREDASESQSQSESIYSAFWVWCDASTCINHYEVKGETNYVKYTPISTED